MKISLKSLAANQTETHDDNGRMIFYSYSTPVAAFIPGRGYVKTSEKFSTTTSKHVTKWTEGRAATVTPAEFADLIA